MKILCPHCGFSKEVDPAKLPQSAKRATCPKCKNKFDLPPREAEVGAPSVPPMPPIPKATAKPTPVPPPFEETPPRMNSGPGAVPPPMPLDFSEERGPAPGASGIPWEDRPGSYFGDLIQTIIMILVRPAEFFDRLPIRGGHKAPLIFALMCGLFTFLVSIVWVVLGTMFQIPMLGGVPPEFSEQFGINLAAFQMLYLGILVVCMPLLVIAGLYIMSVILHLFLIVVRGSSGGFEATFRVTAYTTAAEVFSIVPIIGGLAYLVYSIVLYAMGFPRVHQTTTGRVLVAVLILPCCLCLLFSFGVPFLVSMILSSH